MKHYADIKGGKEFSAFGVNGIFEFLKSMFEVTHSHNVNLEPEARLAVAIKGLVFESDLHTKNVTFRVMGDEDNVNNLFSDKRLLKLETQNIITLGRTNKVPKVDSFIAWVRTREDDKIVSGYHTRRLNRETQRFLTQENKDRSKPVDVMNRMEARNLNSKKNFFVTMNSLSNGNKFPLRFRGVEGEQSLANRVGSYGLSSILEPVFLPNF